MQIMTKYFGELEIDRSNAIHFQSGLPGFAEEKEFILLDFPGNPAFQVLQSIVTPNLAFIATNPYQFYEDYSFDLDDAILSALHITKEQDIIVLAIVTVKQPFSESTINLKAPLIIQKELRVGKQYVLNNQDYPIKATLIPSKKKGE
ncbi:MULTISPECIES: flagellar assembly protein FliW [unclassified Virgibacillus]|uniref:flagellar assembly protein FliW n=1 Tax=unclassified Virgibacillus TaxID=2620237 RepID=UPI0024DE52FF|nr:flagellar assembly protein FliW [Virgibacillus sp. LDC-1]